MDIFHLLLCRLRVFHLPHLLITHVSCQDWRRGLGQRWGFKAWDCLVRVDGTGKKETETEKLN